MGVIYSSAALVVGAAWGITKWRKRDEHFPRVNFDISGNVIDRSQGKLIIDIVASLENKGVVPLKITNFVCELRGIEEQQALEIGGPEIRNQLNFKTQYTKGHFFPQSWDYSFIYPGVKADYNFVTLIPETCNYLLIKGRFDYLDANRGHHAGVVLKIPYKSKNEIASEAGVL